MSDHERDAPPTRLPPQGASPTAGSPQRFSMVTLGVSDVAIARAFYERLGFRAAEFDSPNVTFFQMGGTVLGLYGHDALTEDAGVTAEAIGFRGVTVSINFASKAEVNAALAFAESCGARLIKAAQQVFWGGCCGYLADPDGHHGRSLTIPSGLSTMPVRPCYGHPHHDRPIRPRQLCR